MIDHKKIEDAIDSYFKNTPTAKIIENLDRLSSDREKDLDRENISHTTVKNNESIIVKLVRFDEVFSENQDDLRNSLRSIKLLQKSIDRLLSQISNKREKPAIKALSPKVSTQSKPVLKSDRFGGVKLPTDQKTIRLHGFAFVEIETDTDELDAIEASGGAEWVGRDLNVSKANSRKGKS